MQRWSGWRRVGGVGGHRHGPQNHLTQEESQNARPPLRVCTTLGQLLQEISNITRNISYYLDILVLLHQVVIGKDLVNGDPFCVCSQVPYKCKPLLK